MLIGTTDSPTATSIDKCDGPPCTVGVAGAKFPFITIQTGALTPPQYDAPEQTCQTTLTKSAQKLASTALKGFSTCFGAILKDVGPDATLDPATVTKCGAQLDLGSPLSKVSKAAAKVSTDVIKKCDGLVPADLGSPCNNIATTFAQVATCIQASTLAAVEGQVAAQYSTACTLAIAAGVETDYPGLCN